MTAVSPPASTPPRLSELAHGGGCGCKIGPATLRDILRQTSSLPVPEALLVGISSSDDAAVYRLNDSQALVATTDFFMPIVDDPFDFGRIAATNAISDVYAMGGRPILALALVGMPLQRLGTDVIALILEGGQQVCAAAGIPVAGGHTIESLEPIYGLVVLGLVHPDQVRRNQDAQPGDRLVLGKPLGVGVASAAFKKNALPNSVYEAMLASTTQLNTPGPELAQLPRVHALTDVTGFGLVGHALEMARGSGLALEIDWNAVPLLPGIQSLAEAGYVTGASGRNWQSCAQEVLLPADFSASDQALLCDPQTSGGLLVSCGADRVAEVLELFERHGFQQAREIGRVLPASGAERLLVR
ncbi:MAG: selenide, water dikinase SelD [Synechococcaceae cyanobacterium]|jgi:selenide,water dikinase